MFEVFAYDIVHKTWTTLQLRVSAERNVDGDYDDVDDDDEYNEIQVEVVLNLSEP